MPLKIDELGSNLQNIYSHAFSEKNTSLVASPFGALYESSTIGGTLWKAFHKVKSCCCSCCKVSTQLRKGLIKTERIFTDQCSKVEDYIRRFSRHIRKISLEEIIKPSDQKTNAIARKALEDWSAQITPFLESNIYENQRFIALKNGSMIVREDFLKIDAGLKKKLANCENIIFLENLTGGELPYTVLRKLAKGNISLNDSDKEKLEEWITLLKRIHAEGNANPPAQLTIKSFHAALESFVAVAFNTSKKTVSDKTLAKSISNLVFGLKPHFEEIFNEESPEYLSWRNTLIPGNQFQINGQQMTLQARLGSEQHNERDRWHVFTVEEDPSIVLSAGHNTCDSILAPILVKNYNKEKAASELPVAKVTKAYGDNRFAVVEKLNRLQTFIWNSRSSSLDSKDKENLKPIVKLLKNFRAERRTPKGFNIKHIGLDKNRIVKAIRFLEMGDFDFNALENFCRDVANGNQFIYGYLMKETDLWAQKEARFYQSVFEAALRSDEALNFVEMAHLKEVNDIAIEQRGEQLTVEVRSIAKNCSLRVQNELKLTKEKADKAVKDTFTSLYKKMAAGQIIWPDIENTLFETIRRENPPKKEAVTPKKEAPKQAVNPSTPVTPKNSSAPVAVPSKKDLVENKRGIPQQVPAVPSSAPRSVAIAATPKGSPAASPQPPITPKKETPKKGDSPNTPLTPKNSSSPFLGNLLDRSVPTPKQAPAPKSEAENSVRKVLVLETHEALVNAQKHVSELELLVEQLSKKPGMVLVNKKD